MRYTTRHRTVEAWQVGAGDVTVNRASDVPGWVLKAFLSGLFRVPVRQDEIGESAPELGIDVHPKGAEPYRVRPGSYIILTNGSPRSINSKAPMNFDVMSAQGFRDMYEEAPMQAPEGT